MTIKATYKLQTCNFYIFWGNKTSLQKDNINKIKTTSSSILRQCFRHGWVRLKPCCPPPHLTRSSMSRGSTPTRCTSADSVVSTGTVPSTNDMPLPSQPCFPHAHTMSLPLFIISPIASTPTCHRSYLMNCPF